MAKKLSRALRNATVSLRRNKVQSALSLLGIVIGVFAVTFIVSLGLGLRAYVQGEIESFGKNLISANPAVPGVEERGSLSGSMSGLFETSLTYDDMEALRDPREFPDVVAVTGMRSGQEYVKYRDKELQMTIIGTTPEYQLIDPQLKVGSGRFFTEAEERSLAQVVVLGANTATQLFGDADPVGQKVRVGDLPLTVVGVLQPRGTIAFFDFDTLIFTPLRLTQKRITGQDFLMEVDLIASSPDKVDDVVAAMERMLRRRHGITDPAKDDFVINTATDVLEQVNTVTGAITVLLGFLAAISLLVGGIGIMNIMLVAVAERVREVGLRKALGAKNGDIRAQFLTESVLLTTVGGLAGGLVGFAATMGGVALARAAGFAVPYLVSLPAFVVAGGVSALIGVVFGLYPAKRAAELDAITALRFQ